MAIQIPDAGTGNGATGDNEFVLWTKVINNFTNTTHAASKIVGRASGNIPSYTADAHGTSIDGLGIGGAIVLITSGTVDDVAQMPNGMRTGFYNFESTVDSLYQESKNMHVLHMAHYIGLKEGWRIGNKPNTNDFFLQSSTPSNDPWRKPEKIYHTGNTTIVNGSLKPSSPVVKIHTDSLELNDDAEKMGVTLNKRGVGDYLIQNTTGLRSDGGWRIELPQDVNGNPYFAVDYNELENNDIEVKTYKRIFDMNTFMFGPDLDSPVDIKEGRSIAIRFNDLPQDDIQTEV